MRLDLRPLLALAIFLGLFSALHGAVIWWTYRAYPGRRRWAAAGLLLLLTLCLFLIRPLVPEWISVVGANASLIAASILYLEGARAYRGLRSIRWLGPIASGVAVGAILFFYYVVPDLNARLSVASSFMGVLLILTSIQLLKGRVPEHRLRVTFTAGMFALCGATILARAVYFDFAQPAEPLALFGFNGAFIAGILASAAGFSLGIVLLADERIKSEMKDAQETTARANAEVSERRLVEAVLRESEESFRNLADNAPALIWVSGPDKLCTFFNKPWLDFTGRTMEQELGNGWATGIHPADLERCLTIYSSSFNARVAFRMEYRLRRADGEYRWLVDHGTPQYRNGRFTGYIGSCIDVSEQKLVEDRLRASEIRLKEAQRLTKIGAWEREVEPHRIHWSEELLRIFGVPKAPPDFKEFLNYIHINDRPMLEEATRKIRSGTGTLELEYRIVRPDGEVRIVRSIVEAVRNDQGKPIRFVGATQDITDQVKAGELLRESEERLKHAERLAHVGNWHWDLPTNRLTWSEEMFRIFGHPRDYTPSYEAFFEAVIPSDKERVAGWAKQRLAGRAGPGIEYQIARPNGDVRTITSVSEVNLNEKGLAAQIFGASLDITDFKRAQEESIARQKLETLGTLANGIAHDFNNLLGAVVAQAELALEEVADGSRPEGELKSILNVAIRGSEIVRQLMIYAGQDSEVIEPVDLSRTVEEIIQFLKVSVSKHAKLETDLGKDLPPVRANPAHLTQIVINLVKNASEAMGDRDGLIRVTTRCVTAGRGSPERTGECLAAGNYLRLQVSDTGDGMRRETRARAFDPFFTTKAAGRGLGLATVHGIVRGLGGAIDLTSEPGKGTTVEIMLPCAETIAGKVPEVVLAPKESPMRAATILVVEDEHLLRQAASRMLRKAGFSVIEAEDGSVAVDRIRAQENHIDVLFLDITLPGIPSRQVFKEAARLRPEMRIIVTSAYREEMAAASLDAKLEHFLRKPYRLVDLLELIGQSIS